MKKMFVPALTAILAVLKLAGVLNISWIVVLAPFWVGYVLIIVLGLILAKADPKALAEVLEKEP